MGGGLEEFNKIVEKKFSVFGPAACLGMELGGEIGERLMADALVGSVVHVDEQRFPVGGQSLGVDGKAMVLRCDETSVSPDLSDGLIVSSVAIFQFICGGSGCFREQLVAHADAAYWLACGHGLADVFNRSVDHVGVAGAVGDEETVVGDEVEIIVPRHEHHSDTATGQAADNVVFDAAVNENHGLFAIAMILYLAAAHLSHQIFLVGIVEPRIFRALYYYLAEHRSLVAQMLRERTGVYAIDPGNLFLAEPLGQRAVGLPVGVLPRIVLGHDGTAMDARAFIVLADIVFLAPWGHSVVSENGIGGDKDLTLVRRVGEALGIAGHGGVEHHFARCRAFIAKGKAFETRAVLQNQQRRFWIVHAIELFGANCDTKYFAGFLSENLAKLRKKVGCRKFLLKTAGKVQ